MTEVVTPDRTRATVGLKEAEIPSQTRTIDELVVQAGHLRNVTRVIGDEVEQVHHQAFDVQLNTRAREAAKRPAVELLEQLAAQGFAWRDIARLVRVSVPAVRRWRQEESPTGEHLGRIARLVAFVDMLRGDHLVVDPVGWLEVPLVLGIPVTAVDLLVDERYEDVFDLAALHRTAEEILDIRQPDWRDRYRSDFEVFQAADGEPGIRLRTPDRH